MQKTLFFHLKLIILYKYFNKWKLKFVTSVKIKENADKEDLVGVFSLHKIRLFIKPVPNRPVRMELLPNSGRRVPRLLSYYFMEVDLSELQICIPFL